LLKDTILPDSAPLTEASQSFEQWLVSVGKSVKTAKNYHQVIEDSTTLGGKAAGLVSSPLSHSLSANTVDAPNLKFANWILFKTHNVLGKKVMEPALRVMCNVGAAPQFRHNSQHQNKSTPLLMKCRRLIGLSNSRRTLCFLRIIKL